MGGKLLRNSILRELFCPQESAVSGMTEAAECSRPGLPGDKGQKRAPSAKTGSVLQKAPCQDPDGEKAPSFRLKSGFE